MKLFLYGMLAMAVSRQVYREIQDPDVGPTQLLASLAFISTVALIHHVTKKSS